MKFMVNAKVTAIENEHQMKLKDKTQAIEAAAAILECGQGSDFICAEVYGRDRITVLKQKMLAEKRVDLVISVVGRVKPGNNGMTFYENNVSVKWILS